MPINQFINCLGPAYKSATNFTKIISYITEEAEIQILPSTRVTIHPKIMGSEGSTAIRTTTTITRISKPILQERIVTARKGQYIVLVALL